MKVSNGSAEGQRILQEFVDREVIYCVSSLISELAQEEKYWDDLSPVLQLDDYESAARDQGWDEDSESIFKLPVYDDDYYIDDLLDIAEDLGMGVEEGGDSSGIGYWCWKDTDGTWHGPFDDEDEAKDALVFTNLDRLKAKYEADNHIEVDSWQEACEREGVDPYQRDVFEHWIVSNWFARKLEEEGEATTEFMGLTIWGRTTTGQSISMDEVIQTIYNKLHSNVGDES